MRKHGCNCQFLNEETWLQLPAKIVIGKMMGW